MMIGYNASRRCRLVARPPVPRSCTTYPITQLTGKNSPLSHINTNAGHAAAHPWW